MFVAINEDGVPVRFIKADTMEEALSKWEAWISNDTPAKANWSFERQLLDDEMYYEEAYRVTGNYDIDHTGEMGRYQTTPRVITKVLGLDE